MTKITLNLALFLAWIGLSAGLVGATPQELLRIEIRGIEALNQDIENLAEKFVVPLPPDTVTEGLFKLLHLHDTSGVDLNGTVSLDVFWQTEPDLMEEPDLLLTLPLLDDGSLLIANLSQAWTALSPDDAPVKRFTSPAHLQGSPMARDLYVALKDGYALLTIDPTLLEKEPVSTLKSDLEGRIAIALNMPVVGLIAEKGMKAQVAQMKAFQAQMPDIITDEQIAIQEAQGSMMRSVIKQFDQMGMSINFSEDYLDLYSTLTATSGSILDGIIGTMVPPAETFLKRPPEQTLYSQVGHAQITDGALNAYIKYMDVLLDRMGEYDEQVDPNDHEFTIASLRMMLGQYKGPYAIWLESLPDHEIPIGFTQVWAINDPERLQIDLNEALKLMPSPSDDEPAVLERTYRDITVYSYNMASMMAADEHSQMLFMMWPPMKHIGIEQAVVGDVYVGTMGEGEIAMNRAIDRIQHDGDSQPVTDHPFIQRHHPDLPDAAIEVWYFDPMETIATVLRTVGKPKLSEPFEKLKGQDIAVTGYAHLHERKWVATARMDIKGISAIFHAIKSLQQMGAGSM